MSEKLSSSVEIAKNADNNSGDWLENEANGGAPVPEFKNNYYYDDFNGSLVEVRDVNEIDISTENGKYDWLDSILDNVVKIREERLKNYDCNVDEETEKEEKIQSDLDFAKIQQEILHNRIDPNNGDVLDNLRKEKTKYDTQRDKLYKTGRADSAILEKIAMRAEATQNLIDILEDETRKRNGED